MRRIASTCAAGDGVSVVMRAISPNSVCSMNSIRPFVHLRLAGKVTVQRRLRYADACRQRRRGDFFRLRFLQHCGQRLQDLQTGFPFHRSPFVFIGDVQFRCALSRASACAARIPDLNPFWRERPRRTPRPDRACREHFLSVLL
jgi:hypothetical protein